MAFFSRLFRGSLYTWLNDRLALSYFTRIVCFMLVGPFLAAGLYDVSWEMEKGHKPRYAILYVQCRNAFNEWGFAILLIVMMIFWLRVSSLIHALYPPYIENDLENLLPFLALGTIVGAGFTLAMLFITAFTQPILMERKVDLATAVLTSVNAVWLNKVPCLFGGYHLHHCCDWFVTGFVGFIDAHCRLRVMACLY